MAINPEIQKFVMDADCVIRAEQRFKDVIGPLTERFLDPSLQDAAAQFLTSDELQRATAAARDLSTFQAITTSEGEVSADA